MVYIILNEIFWKSHSGLPLSNYSFPNGTGYLGEILEVYKNVHVPAQIRTHTVDSGTVRMESTGILGS